MTVYATAEQIGGKVGVTASTIKRWAREGLIPSLRPTGRVLRFDPDKVEQALRDRSAGLGSRSTGDTPHLRGV